MKKIYFLLCLVSTLVTAQVSTQIINKPLKLTAVSQGASTDSIMSIDASGNVRYVLKSSLVSAIPTFQQVTGLGNETTNDVFFGSASNLTNIKANSGEIVAVKDSIWSNLFGAKGISQYCAVDSTSSGFSSNALSLFDQTTTYGLGLRTYKMFFEKNGFQTNIEAPNDLDNSYIQTTPKASGVFALEGYVNDQIFTNSTLQNIDEGNGIGIIRAGREPLNYGNIGFESIDLSFSNSSSSTKGATGIRAYSQGINNTASGNISRATGDGTVASGSRAVSEGYNSLASGNSSHAEGDGTVASGITAHAEGSATVASGNASNAQNISTIARSLGETSIGIYNTDYTPISASIFDNTDRIFVIGNGASVASRSDALIVLKDGTITAPSLTNAKITSAGLKAIPTVEYLNTVITSGATPDATPTVKGKAKLFTTLGTSTDGSIDQNTANTNFNLKENTANKVTTITGNEASTTLFPVVKANLDFLKLGLVGLLPAKSTSLVDADLLLAGDSADSFKTKTRTFGQLKSTLSSTFFLDATSSIQTQINSKQATLVSGTNIKTINGNSLLGSGNLVVSGSGGTGSEGGRTGPYTTSSLTTVNAGLGFGFTLAKSGLFLVIISGDVSNSVGGSGVKFTLNAGSPFSNVPSAGSPDSFGGNGIYYTVKNGNATGIGVSYTPESHNFSIQTFFNGYTTGMQVWIDMAFASITSGISTLKNINISVIEL